MSSESFISNAVSQKKIVPSFKKKKKAKSSSSTFTGASSSESNNNNKVVPSFKRKIQNTTKDTITYTKLSKDNTASSTTTSNPQTVPVFAGTAPKKPKTNFMDENNVPATPKVKNVVKSSNKPSLKTPSLKTPNLKTPDISIKPVTTPSSKSKRQSSDSNIRMAPSKKLKTPMDQYPSEVTSSTSINQSNSSKFACVTKQPITSSQGLSLANEILQKLTSSQQINQSQDSVPSQQVWEVFTKTISINLFLFFYLFFCYLFISLPFTFSRAFGIQILNFVFPGTSLLLQHLTLDD